MVATQLTVRRHRCRPVATTVLVVLLLAAGWVLGHRALIQPSVALDTEHSFVEILVGEPETSVDATWSLAADGSVSINVDHVSQDAPVAFLLSGDARFREVPANAQLHLLEPSDSASDQLIVPTGPPAGPVSPSQFRVTGQPVGVWHASRAGVRVALLPRVLVGPASPLWTPKGWDGGDWWRVETAAVRTQALADTGDLLVQHYPDAPPAHVVVEQTLEGVAWAKPAEPEGAIDAFSGGAQLPPARVRWENPEGVARAQLELLLSGVLLGVAAALAVEELMAWLRHRG